MKKLLVYFAILSGSFSLFAQESNSTRKNDIMIDPIIMIAVPALNASYERLVNEETGIGVNFLYGLDGDDGDFLQVSPYYRMYFGKNFASGFFVEAFVPITSTNDSFYYTEYDNNTGQYYETYYEDKATTVGFGIAAGGKWLTKKNIVFEVAGGIGRRFGADDNDFFEPVVPRVMLGIGYRF